MRGALARGNSVDPAYLNKWISRLLYDLAKEQIDSDGAMARFTVFYNGFSNEAEKKYVLKRLLEILDRTENGSRILRIMINQRA